MKMKISDEIYNKLDYAKSIVTIYPDESMEVSKEAYNIAKFNNLKIEEGYALVGMALSSRIKSDITSMLDYSYKALDIFQNEKNILGQIKALNLIGIAYFYSSIYEESLKSFLKVINLLELNNDDSLLANVLNNIGEIYRESEVYDMAMEYYEKAIDTSLKNNHKLTYAAILSNIGEVYFKKKEFDIALDTYNKSHEIFSCGNDTVNLGEVENKIGKVYYTMKDMDRAEEYYLKSYNRLKGIDNKYYIIDVLINLADLYKKTEPDKTLYYYGKAIEYTKDIGAKKKLFQVYKLLSKYYEDIGDYKSSLEFYKRYLSINEEIMNSSLRTKLEVLNIEFRNIHSKDKSEQLRSRLEEEIVRQNIKLEKIRNENAILEKKAYEDELTGIPNRRYINKNINKIIEDVSLDIQNIVLFMIDIDNFKKYNDCWGHSEGDICIKKITETIKKIQINKSDIFGRYGGEEFVYISTNLSYKEAFDLGNLLRIEVENIGLYYIDNEEKRSVTISVGGVIGRNFGSISNIMELADVQLYKAKARGRNITLLTEN